MAISFSCPCGKRMQAKGELAGKRVKCAACQQIVAIPQQPGNHKSAAAIEVACKCGKRIKAKPELAGKKVKCPACQGVIAIPGGTAAKAVAPQKKAAAPPTQTISKKAARKPDASARGVPRSQRGAFLADASGFQPKEAAPKTSVTKSPAAAPKAAKAPVKATAKAPLKTPQKATTSATPSPRAAPPAPSRPPARPLTPAPLPLGERGANDDDDAAESRAIPWKAVGMFSVFVGLVAVAAWYLLGPKAGYVSGQVTFDGKPLAGVDLVFKREDGTLGPMPATSDAAGNYELHGPTSDGVPVGAYIVMATKMVAQEGKDVPADADAPAPDPSSSRFINMLPPDYAVAERTKLRASVGRGSNRINIELKSRPD